MSKKTRVFKAEVQQVLDLVIHSLYSKKEIFLRELISNASDAIDRAQYLGLTDKSLIADAPNWKIDLIVDKEDKTLTITDNGIGMNEEDLDKNLGVIANSGTKAFAQALKEKQQTNIPELIGQFGVGFYAAFMVAESVTVITLKRGEGQKAVKWTSTGTGSYTLEEAARDKPGTTIVLKLREGMEEFLNEWRLHELVKKYSDFIAYPIRFSDTGEAPAEDAQPFNTMKAIWKRPKSELTEEATNEFYTHLTHDYNPPLKTIPMSVEGVVEFKALLFLPKQAGIDLMMPNKKYGLHLYVRNVFIGADFDLLLPEYLRFVKGVVDSSDLPLNVSREMLQDDAVIRKIKSNITGKVLSTLAEMMADEPETYTAFFTAFGRVLKEGLHHDYENADKLKALMMFRSATRDGNALISLADYVKAMPETQQDIYYLIAEDLETAKRAPHIEALTKRGYDVLLFTDPIDQWIADTLREFEGKKLVAVDKGALEVGTDEEKAAAKKKIETAADDFKELTAFIQEHLKDHVKEVRFSPRLTDSACCLVADENALNPSMERLMRAMNQDVPKQLRTLELNPDHAVIARMKSMLEADKADPRLADFADLLFGQALLAEGSAPQNPQRFTQLVAELMTQV
ncbi:MAG: molecular chaperone HtpG [Kiritimatiellae bacterium]|jgi:molecular chaperone HtpG|nr:molecular chaperone HtpG [Kiritimatiellia bacterium]MDD2347459.1 molecular chaperone HtpG [Kiritimatiellia bacterium]MDD3585193.1 molecular chaperone HtpG [Kiritimatiellia bacterium]HHU14350.1 molecular chaperone HtpG [Lentisphaerota bacterium]HON47152.1 molecular chaperone HtpG [Kiritimatiellia bacterium]